MKDESIMALSGLLGKAITVRNHTIEFAQVVCGVMDTEGIDNRETAMFYLLDRAQIKARLAGRDWDNPELSKEYMRSAREYITIAVKLARSGE